MFSRGKYRVRSKVTNIICLLRRGSWPFPSFCFHSVSHLFLGVFWEWVFIYSLILIESSLRISAKPFISQHKLGCAVIGI